MSPWLAGECRGWDSVPKYCTVLYCMFTQEELKAGLQKLLQDAGVQVCAARHENAQAPQLLQGLNSAQ